mgnify:CR=1 FL=1
MIRLLIADDERMEREALADIVMRRFEHEVTVEMAENGRKAADTAVLWEADLILMDIEMPGMNGLDAARAVLEQRPECKVIFITAYSLLNSAWGVRGSLSRRTACFSTPTRRCIWVPATIC